MQVWKSLWNDESGMVLSAEAVLVGTIGVLGATVGLTAASRAVNEELTEMAFAIRSLDQSYSFNGMANCNSWTAGSRYIQPSVEESIADLCAEIETMQPDDEHDDDDHAEDMKSKAAEQKKKEEQKKREAERKKREQDRKKKEETSLTA